jgi:thiamine-phosphate pyrophosphorylase
MSTLHQGREEAIRELRRERVDAARLYFVCEARPQGKDPAPLLAAGLRGGVDILQLRDKEADDRKLIEAASAFRAAADAHGALFILNDRPDLVAACAADGVHVGQDDPPVAEARRLAGAGVLVGLSTHSADQVDAACVAEGDARPDQISVGPVWETPTKDAAVQATIPWFAIGGIDPSNVGEVVAAGAGRVVVVRAIRDADDPEGAARELRSALPGDPDG